MSLQRTPQLPSRSHASARPATHRSSCALRSAEVPEAAPADSVYGRQLRREQQARDKAERRTGAATSSTSVCFHMPPTFAAGWRRALRGSSQSLAGVTSASLRRGAGAAKHEAQRTTSRTAKRRRDGLPFCSSCAHRFLPRGPGCRASDGPSAAARAVGARARGCAKRPGKRAARPCRLTQQLSGAPTTTRQPADARAPTCANRQTVRDGTREDQEGRRV